MICKPEDAKNYQCCAMLGSCQGNKCMAWRVWYEVDIVRSSANRGLPLPPVSIPTDKGYCGLAYK